MKRWQMTAASFGLAVCVAACGAFAWFQRKNGIKAEASATPVVSGSSETGVSNQDNIKVSSDENIIVGNTSSEIAETEEKQKASEISLSYKNGNSWESNGTIYTQYDVSITNHSSKEVTTWKTQLQIPSGSKLDQGWNAAYSCSKDTLTAQPMDYNATIAAGQSVSYGFILITPKKFTPQKTKIVVKQSDQKTTVNQTESTENTENDANTDSPKATKKPATKKSSTSTKPTAAKAKKESNPVKKHGRLTVKGTKIYDSHKKVYQLKGVSTHGIAWFPQYVNEKAFKTLRDKYHVNAIRLAMYTNPADGYSKSVHATVKKGVDAATKLGMYVIIDWHILNDNNPNMHKKAAKSFFTKMAKAYKGHKNVLYEICNEPNGNVTWQNDIKPYANSMIKTIRKYDKHGIIIVGTSTWSQDVDQAAQSPIKHQKNIVYTCHFYAATHKDDLRNKVNAAIKKGIPVFISEYNICDCSGNGGVDYDSAKKWFSFIKKQKLSCFAWNLSNKAETSSLIKSSCQKKSGWKTSDLSKTGKWIFKEYGKY